MNNRKTILHRLAPAATALANAGYPLDDCVFEAFDADASVRQFVRLIRSDGKTAICVLDCGYVADYLAVPLTNTSDLWPINLVSAFGEEHHIPMPKVFALDTNASIALIEDLGNERLQDRLFAVQDAEIAPLFLLCFELLDRKRRATDAALLNKHFVAWREWDLATIRWEIDHFLEGCIEPYLQNSTTHTRLRGAMMTLATEIDALPKVLTHRDFHARNLMMTGSASLAVIDYEDMLIGREGYDAGSLISDTYLYDRLDASMTNALFDLWAYTQAKPVRWVRMCALHRMLRTAGRFAWLASNGRGDHWLDHIPLAIEKARVAAAGQPDLEEIMELLGSLERH